jgi:hypothetical protein
MKVQGHISRSSFVNSNAPKQPYQSSKTRRKDSKAQRRAQQSLLQQNARKEAVRAHLQHKLKARQSGEEFKEIRHVFFISVLQQLATLQSINCQYHPSPRG